MQIRCNQVDHRNQQIIGCCIDNSCPNQKPYCNFCLPLHAQHLEKLISLELLHEWIQRRIHSALIVQKNVSECKLSLDRLLNFLIPYVNFNIQQYSEIGLTSLNKMIIDFCQVESYEELLFKHLKQSIQQIIFIIDQIQKNIKKVHIEKEICNQQLQISERKSLISLELKQIGNFKSDSNQFTFELMIKNSIKQVDVCYAVAFNKDQSLVLAGCGKDIKVFQNLQGNLNQIQMLREHRNDVNTLNFMKDNNNILSGSSDNTIIIWQEIGHNQWLFQQKLNGHSNSILSLLLNNNEDLILSASVDKTIKFWVKQNQWLCQQTITEHTDSVYSLSLNEQQNKLISCSKDSQILVIEQSKLDKQWIVIQKIKVDQYGYRLCIINDNQFTFQPRCKEQMHLFELDNNNKQYRKTKEFTVRCGSYNCDILFPFQYLKSKCLLANKNGKNVNLMRRIENGNFIIQQSIEFGSEVIYGQLSENGEYLITWDFQTKEIQVRKYKKL
ncbi:unnamed protein product [Paramecium sonneborni]|uniref:WD domain, G-beta repeat protein n=1 Tax=Paramecium sonneborni TaxID=65129 RepID=A0A8S1MSH2_9CILI|nr:unnamed protein product [Paramecium sonneborni]